MGYPRFHEQPTLLLIYRTIRNLEHVDEHKSHGGPFEVTQLINSFTGVFAHPWDQLLDQEKLRKVKLDSRQFRDCRFPNLPYFEPEAGGITVDNAYQYLRVLRNSMSHGNIELLDRKQIRKLRQRGSILKVTEKEIAGLRLWNTPTNSRTKTWISVLDIHEMRSAIEAMARLCEKRSLWIDEVRVDFERRRRKRVIA